MDKKMLSDFTEREFLDFATSECTDTYTTEREHINAVLFLSASVSTHLALICSIIQSQVLIIRLSELLKQLHYLVLLTVNRDLNLSNIIKSAFREWQADFT